MLPRTLLFMLVCAAIGFLIGRTRGMGLQGFFLGFAFGPLGWGLILLWPRTWIQGPMPKGASGHRDSMNRGRPGSAFRNRPQDGSPESGNGCRRCGRPVQAGASACPSCGNVLVPIRYRVNSGNAGNPA